MRQIQASVWNKSTVVLKKWVTNDLIDRSGLAVISAGQRPFQFHAESRLEINRPVMHSLLLHLTKYNRRS